MGLSYYRRLIAIALVLFILFSLLIIQFYKIQILEHAKWTRMAALQHKSVVIEPGKRGIFYSNTSLRKGHPDKPQPFVIDVPKFHLYADPMALTEGVREEVVQALSLFLRLSPEDVRKVRVQLGKKSRSRKLVMWMQRPMRDAIHKWWLGYAKVHKIPSNALFFIQDYKRSYPFGSLLGSVLHTVRQEKDATGGECIPTGGLELFFHSMLKGKEGKRVMLRGARRPLEMGYVLVDPVDGADVYLTINHHLQAIAEEEIAKAVQKASAKGGWALLMDPHTGEIWALAQYPCFDPSNYARFFNDPLLKEHAKVKAVTDPYEPGSTLKPFTLTLCLKANAELRAQGKPPLFDPDEKIATSPTILPGRSKPIKDTSHHKFLNMYLGLQKSSNVYMAKMARRIIERLGPSWYRATLQETFGFGKKTNLELPAETPGLLPQIGKKHPNGTLEWSASTPYSLAMGHNILVNSIQMVRAYAVLANDGHLVDPTLVRKIMKNGKNLMPTNKEPFPKVLDSDIVQHMLRAMKATTKPGGSASRGDIFGFTEVGKTGTTEKVVGGVYSKKDHISTFVGFAPVENARFVLLIAIDEPEYKYIEGVGRNQLAGVCAASAFREIGARTLQYLGAEPDDPYGYPPGDPRYDPTKADWIQESLKLKALYDQWNK